MSGLMDKIRGLFGKPGSTQRPGSSSGGPGDGPTAGGTTGPAGADPSGPA